MSEEFKMNAEFPPKGLNYEELRDLIMERQASTPRKCWGPRLPSRNEPSERFQQEYMGTPILPTREERRLRELGRQYREQCEAYDQRVCSWRTERGIAMPADAYESILIARNARYVFNRLMEEVARLGFQRRDLSKAIRKVKEDDQSIRSKGYNH